MGAPIVYRWDDANAPVARAESTSFVEILTACLVDGYGEKPAAGWTKEFVNVEGTKAAFRNDPIAGSGFFFRAENISSYIWLVQAYETMDTLDTGLGPFADVSLYTHVGMTDLTPRQWVLIADNRCFYWLHNYYVAADGIYGSGSYDRYSKFVFFGDIISRNDPDPYGCALVACDSTSNGIGSSLAETDNPNSSSAPGMYLARNFAGDAAICKTTQYYPGGTCYPGYSGSYGSPRSSGLTAARPALNDGTPYSFRGFLPGFYAPGSPYADFTQYEEVVIDGKTFLVVRGMAGSSLNQYEIVTLFDIGEGFRP